MVAFVRKPVNDKSPTGRLLRQCVDCVITCFAVRYASQTTTLSRLAVNPVFRSIAFGRIRQVQALCLLCCRLLNVDGGQQGSGLNALGA